MRLSAKCFHCFFEAFREDGADGNVVSYEGAKGRPGAGHRQRHSAAVAQRRLRDQAHGNQVQSQECGVLLHCPGCFWDRRVRLLLSGQGEFIHTHFSLTTFGVR